MHVENIMANWFCTHELVNFANDRLMRKQENIEI